MTSSLVGSEMCIRDSTIEFHRTMEEELQDARQRNEQVRAAAGQASLNAVSYTHLTLPTICSV
eukprot:4932014-Prorocentrum_lima.AAC.1